MGNIFLEKKKKCDGKPSPRPFSERLKLSICLSQWFKILCSSFLLNPKLRSIKLH